MILFPVALAVVTINIPCGFWRAGTRKFSPAWFAAVHLPVPVVAAMRHFSGLGWQLSTVPVLVGSYFLGQWLGGRLRQWYGGRVTD